MATQAQRLRAIRLYKEAAPSFGARLPGSINSLNAPAGNAKLTDPAKIDQMLDLAEFIKKETLALYSLSKYRHLKRSYES
ncbi:unnamed protein product [Rhizoctonia solani]|uniref:Uncharacterized protein n=1 Tax=Rhizoctonia solani TaxID=456999 RepID=A0A8H2XX81_9AGAM|nr:unnamed protein product [Rhizoctonia solani]